MPGLIIGLYLTLGPDLITMQTYKLNLLTTGKITEFNDVTQLFEEVVYQRVGIDFGNLPPLKTAGYQRRMHVLPIDPATPAQIARRSKFATAVNNWQLMSDSQKQVWKDKGAYLNLPGYNYYISEFLKTE